MTHRQRITGSSSRGRAVGIRGVRPKGWKSKGAKQNDLRSLIAASWANAPVDLGDIKELFEKMKATAKPLPRTIRPHPSWIEMYGAEGTFRILENMGLNPHWEPLTDDFFDEPRNG